MHNLRLGGVRRKGLPRGATPRRALRPPGPAVVLRRPPAWPPPLRSLDAPGRRRGGGRPPPGPGPADATPSTGLAPPHGRPHRPPHPGEPARSGGGTRPWPRARKPRLAVPQGREAHGLPDPPLDLAGHVGVLGQELSRVLPALAELVALVGEPGAALLHDLQVHADVEEAPLL